MAIVFAALAISRHLQDTTGVSIKRLIRMLRLLRTVQINVGGHIITADQRTRALRARADWWCPRGVS
jgi:hypothetical protein